MAMAMAMAMGAGALLEVPALATEARERPERPADGGPGAWPRSMGQRRRSGVTVPRTTRAEPFWTHCSHWASSRFDKCGTTEHAPPRLHSHSDLAVALAGCVVQSVAGRHLAEQPSWRIWREMTHSASQSPIAAAAITAAASCGPAGMAPTCCRSRCSRRAWRLWCSQQP